MKRVRRWLPDRTRIIRRSWLVCSLPVCRLLWCTSPWVSTSSLAHERFGQVRLGKTLTWPRRFSATLGKNPASCVIRNKPCEPTV